MSTVKTDAIETRAGGTSVLTIGTATQTIKLPGGTPGADKVLTSNATGEASWAVAATSSNSPSFAAYNSSAQGLNTASYDKVLATTEEHDVGSCYDATNSKFTVPAGEGGKYAVWARGVIYNTSGNSETKAGGLFIYKNGSATWNAITTEDGKFTEQSMNFFSVVTLAAADYLELYTWCVTIAGNTSLAGGPDKNMWGAFKLAGV